ncbi:MAG: rod shape-determining protein MreD [Parvularculaceae bacterium]
MAAGDRGVSGFATAAAPTVLGLFGVALLAAPLRPAEGWLPAPVLPLVVVYFWSIYGPRYLPPASVFAIGLTQDLVLGGPLGLWSGIYLVTQVAALSQRDYFRGREQKVVWLGFCVAAAFAASVFWLAMSLVSGAALPWPALAAQMLATIAVYPLVAAGFAELHARGIAKV